MMPKKGEKRPLSKMFLRLLKIVPVFFLALFILILAGLITLAFWPRDSMARFLSHRLSNEDYSISIGTARVNPFGHVTLTQVSLSQPAGDTLLTFEDLQIRFRPLPLLHRRLIVSRVFLEHPSLRLLSLKNSSQEEPADTVAAPRKNGPPLLPLALALGRLDLTEIDVAIPVSFSGEEGSLLLEGVSLSLDSLLVPRNAPSNPAATGGRLRLFTSEGRLLIDRDNQREIRELDLHLEARWRRNAAWRLSGGLGVSRMNREGSRLSFSLLAQGEGLDSLKMDEALLTLGEWDLFRIRGKRDSEGLQLTLESDPIPLRPTADTLLALLPSGLADSVDTTILDAELLPLRGSLSGSRDSLSLQLRARMRADRLTPAPDSPRLQEVTLGAKAEAHLKNGRMRRAGVSLSATSDSLVYFLSDGTAWRMGGFSLDASATLDTLFHPVQGTLEAGLSSLFGGAVSLVLDWSLPGGNLPSLRARAGLNADSLDLAALSLLSPETQGRLHCNADVSVEGFHRITGKMTASSDSIGYLFQDRLERSPPLLLTMSMLARADSSLSRINLDSLRCDLEDLFSLSTAASYRTGEKLLEISDLTFTLDNSRLAPLFPFSLKRQVSGGSFSGREVLSASLRAGPGHFTSSGTFEVKNGGFRSEDSSLALDSLSCIADWQSKADSLDGNVALRLGRAVLPDNGGATLGGARMEFRFGSRNLEWLSLEDGRIVLDKAGILGGFSMRADSILAEPRLSLDAGLHFHSERLIPLPAGVRVRGDLVCRAAFRSNTEGLGVSRLQGSLSGILDTLLVDSLLSLKRMAARLPFSLAWDSTGLSRDSLSRPFSGLEYSENRAIYRGLTPTIGSVEVQEMTIGKVRLTSLSLDARLADGRLDIPWMAADILGGNLRGSIGLDLPSSKDEVIAYRVSAQLARINAAALSRESSTAGEDNLIDVSLNFQGRGMDPAGGMDVQGYFHITRIGARFAGTLLQQLDPRGADRSIRLTRRLLNIGWKPKLFSFELRHGYVYPALSLAQPWFSPIRLPETLTYGRLPLEFFLNPSGRSKQ